MEEERPEAAGQDSPVTEVMDGEYYYLKALSYLATSAESGSDDGHCSCLHCLPHDKLDFSLGFRPGLAVDDSRSCSSPETSSSGCQYSASAPSSSSSHLSKPGKACLKSSGDESGRKRLEKRRSSDGHVHWADEFQKDLTRSRPRKTYSRHPSLATSRVKPILKANTEDGEAS